MSQQGRRLPWGRVLSIGLLGVTTAVGMRHVLHRYGDEIGGSDMGEGMKEWIEHSREELPRRRFSGMHRPFLTGDRRELQRFQQSFANYSFLMFKDVNELIERTSIDSSVHIFPLSSCPKGLPSERVRTLVVGGPPALLAATELIRSGREEKKQLIYCNEKKRVPISNGSAWHLEQDAPSEAPTGYSPWHFFLAQVRRLLLDPVFLHQIEVRGEFPWRTLDWLEWLKHPSHWWRAMKIFVLYQRQVLFDPRLPLLESVAEQCQWNEKYFQELDKDLQGTLLDGERGSIIVARNREELEQMKELNVDLQREGKALKKLSAKEMVERYAFVPNGLAFAQKTHDRLLVSSFMSRLENYLRENKVQTLDGKLTKIFLNEKDEDERSPRFALFQLANGEERLIEFSRLILSLGNQSITSSLTGRLFDVIAARGVSVLAHLYLPRGVHLPSLTVCGGTNHLTRLNSSPIAVDDGRDLHLVRLTAGATITPNLCHERTSFYDSTIALGLIRSVQLTLGERFDLRPLVIYGCNRQVSANGQIHWFEPMKKIHIQFGAAGGGLTRAPDFIRQSIKE